MKKVKCGMKVYIRGDLEPGVYYGGEVWASKMERGNWVIVNDVSDNIDGGQEFFIKRDPYTYTSEMVDWPMTNKTAPYPGQTLYLRDDLIDGEIYDSKYWFPDMKKGEWVVVDEVSRVDGGSPYLFTAGGNEYSSEMVDWDKTNNPRPSKVVKEGMKVYLRDDLREGVPYEPGKKYWLEDHMKRGEWVTVRKVFSDNNRFHIVNGGPLIYTSGMVDWDKSLPLNTEDTPTKEDYKIRFVLKRYDNYLVFQVIQQCDSITAKNIYKESLLKFTASNGFEIWSASNPWISKDYLCIGGSVSKTGTTVGEFKSSSEAKEVMETAIKALAEWKANKYFTQANEIEEIEIASDGYYEL